MSKRFSKFLFRFKTDESGNTTIEFVILFPIVMTMFMSAVEVGIYSMRQMWLDRGLDIAMREVRLNTQNVPTYQDLRQTICDNAGFLPDCENNLKIEMQPVDPRAFVDLGPQIDCVDRSVPIQSQDPPNYVSGNEHDLVLVRACLKFDPVFPLAGLGYDMVESGDSEGMSIMSARSAFVQEPGATVTTTPIAVAGGGT